MYGLVNEKSTFESRTNVAVSAAILHLAVCGCDVISKSVCVADVSEVCTTSRANMFLPFIGEEHGNMSVS